MEIRLLKKGYSNDENFYKDFLENRIIDNDEYFSGEVVHIDEAPDFPIYINTGDEEERLAQYNKAFEIISKYYLNTDRDIHFDEVFWHSLLCVYKQKFLLETYPQIRDDHSSFKNIVIKSFNWENYIYKCVLAAQYITDNIVDEEERKVYFKLVVDNLDLFNYIIKYEIFRNDKFLINVLGIVRDNDLSSRLKAKIKGRDDLGKDERVGRRVIFEFNKCYPNVVVPALEKEELEVLFMEYLGRYE